MNYGQLVSSVLQIMDEYSSRGIITAAVKTADIRIKIPAATNQVLMSLATTTGKIPAEWKIINYPVMNNSSLDTSSIKNHDPLLGDDIIAVVNGARSFFLEVCGYYHVVIEESVNGEWVTLKELIPSEDGAPTDFTELKGLLNPSGLANLVRIRITGDYVYTYRNYILYPYTFPTDEDVQQNRPFFLVPLPSDWLKLNNVMIRRDPHQWLAFAEYKVTPTMFGYNRWATGEILVNYYRKPKTVIVVDPANPTAEELTQDIDATPDAAQVVAFGVAGTVLANDDAAASSYLLNIFETGKFQLMGQDGSYGVSGGPTLIGW